MNPRILIVDDDPAECALLCDSLRAETFEVESTLEPHQALEMLATRPFDAVVTDLNMPGMRGTELCQRVKQQLPPIPVVVVTAFGSIDTAVHAMRAGAYDFIVKPFDIDAVSLVLRRAVEHHSLRQEVDALRRVIDDSGGYGQLLGTSQPMREVYAMIDRIAANDAPLLITGESGTGKELAAREVHRRSKRQDGPFVPCRFGAIPDGMLDRELFGEVSEPGQAPRGGLLLAAAGGTLLLDEIGDIPTESQLRLQQVLERRELRLPGGKVPVPLEARVIATSNRDLEQAIEDRRLNRELLGSVKVFHVELPPLRARGGDVLSLARGFLAEVNVRARRQLRGFTAAAAEKLLGYHWPGNLRELRNCVDRAAALASSDHIDAGDLPEKVRQYQATHVLVAGDDPSELVPLEEVEKRYILRVVEACHNNKSRAARVLGISRKTLYRRLLSLGVRVDAEEAERD